MIHSSKTTGSRD